MKNIVKFLFIGLLIPLFFTSCEDENYRDWTTPEPSFTLYDTTLGTNVLYESMADNPFTLAWDNSLSASGGYSVVFSATEDFASKVELGTSTTNSYTTSVGDLNTALLQAGWTPYTAQTVYIRIETAGGSIVSNAISFTVTPYPAEGPVITAPTAGSSIVLDNTLPEDVAATVTWNDYSGYGVSVEYLVEVAAAGSSAFFPLGTVSNTYNFEVTHSVFNTAVLKTGAQIDVPNDIDIRVTAISESTGGTIQKQSEVVTIKVTPYESFVQLFLIGSATAAGWDNNATNINMYPLLNSHSNSNSYTFTGYFSAGAFKIVKTKGSWGVQYGAGSSAGTLSTSGGDISVAAAGYYQLSIDTAALTYTLVPVSAPTASYSTIGIIGSATPNGWSSSTAMTQSTFDSHIWMLENTALTDGEMKFRANDSWDINWGSGDENFGTGTQGGANIPVSAGVYDIYFNDNTGDYVFVKKD
ncbi:MAG: SusF/SusE family outer membrane protein [Bergeyella sp.]